MMIGYFHRSASSNLSIQSDTVCNDRGVFHHAVEYATLNPRTQIVKAGAWLSFHGIGTSTWSRLAVPDCR